LEGAAAFASDLRHHLDQVAAALDRRQRSRTAAKTRSDVGGNDGHDERLVSCWASLTAFNPGLGATINRRRTCASLPFRPAWAMLGHAADRTGRDRR
jgi:hypothetical protein